MSLHPIMDAGPGLNFLSLNKERLLFDTVGPLRVPEKLRKKFFASHVKIIDSLQPKASGDDYLSDSFRYFPTTPLTRTSAEQLDASAERRSNSASAFQRISEKSWSSHTPPVAAESGENVIILIDDSGWSYRSQQLKLEDWTGCAPWEDLQEAFA